MGESDELSNAEKKGESRYIRKIRKRIKELTIKKNSVGRNTQSRNRLNFAIGELMFLIQE